MDVRSTIFQTLCAFFYPFRHHHTPVSTTNMLGTYKTEHHYETYDEPFPVPIRVHVNLSA